MSEDDYPDALDSLISSELLDIAWDETGQVNICYMITDKGRAAYVLLGEMMGMPQ